MGRLIATPDWEVITLHGVGHVAQLEVPVAFVKMVTTWWQRNAAVMPVVVAGATPPRR